MSELNAMMAAGAHPSSWDGFIGQEKAKLQLRTKAAAARANESVMGHIMIHSPEPGIGKTSLGMLIAQEAGRGVRVVSGQLGIDEARFHLSQMEDGDVLLWDEIHQQFEGGRRRWEWLLHYLQHGMLLTPMGPEPHARITIVGCTTDMGKIPETISQRLESTVRLEPYNDVERQMICATLAGSILGEKWPASLESIDAVAAASSGKPRVMQRLWKGVRDLATMDAIAHTFDERGDFVFDLSTVFQWEGVRPDGLTELAVEYLHVCYVENRMQPVGFDRLVQRLREDAATVTTTEQLLQDRGLVMMASRGRVLTTEGMKLAKELAVEVAA